MLEVLLIQPRLQAARKVCTVVVLTLFYSCDIVLSNYPPYSTICLENLEMSGNLTAVREMLGILLKSGKCRKKFCQGKVA